MKYTEKPKTIEAVQFNGYDNIGEIMRLCRPRGIRYEEKEGERKLFIQLRLEECSYEVKQAEYIILVTEGLQRRLVIVPEDEFEDKYQRATNPFGVHVNDNGTITGFGIGVPQTTAIRG